MTLQFEWPLVFLLLPLPFLVRLLLPSGKRLSEAVLLTSFARDLETSSGKYSAAGNFTALLLAILAWILLVTAAARPQLLGEPQDMPVSGRDLLVAVDVSGSMRLRDFQLAGKRVARLDATKHVASDFIARRTGDRVGLILFGRRAYLQTPLTFDRRTVSQLLQEAFVGIAGSETAIGDAIGLAVKRLRDSDVKDKILILLTDGANTAGAVDPIKAAQLAATDGLTIYTVGIGSDARSFGGFSGGFRGASASLDERSLQKIADLTGGRYFRARNVAQLQEIYQLLDRLEPVDHETAGFRPSFSLFHWPLSVGMLLLALLLAWRLGIWNTILKGNYSGRKVHG